MYDYEHFSKDDMSVTVDVCGALRQTQLTWAHILLFGLPFLMS